MKLIVVIACSLLALASGDVSHLSKQYLPPRAMHGQGHEDQDHQRHVTTTIEKQELQELPEQIEYVDQPSYGHMEPMMDDLLRRPSAQYLPPAMVREAQQHEQHEQEPQEAQEQPRAGEELEEKPQDHELPHELPQEQPQEAVEATTMPSSEYLPPEEPAPVAPAAPLNQYLAPPPAEDEQQPMMATMEPQQPNYQQYQEELMRQQQQQHQMMMAMMMMEQMDGGEAEPEAEAVQPQAPVEPAMEVESVEAMEPMMAMEPEPAHVLAADGYHYKSGDEARFRLRH